MEVKVRFQSSRNEEQGTCSLPFDQKTALGEQACATLWLACYT